MDEPLHAEAVPNSPRISAEQLEECRKTGDFCPILFEWYKFTGALCNFFASIKRESVALRSVPAQDYYVLIGLLNRCSRLMLANVALSHEGVFGETPPLSTGAFLNRLSKWCGWLNRPSQTSSDD